VAGSAKLLRFGLVGIAATAIYAVLALAGGAVLGLGAVAASIAAYGIAGLFSYLAQKRLTFRSDGDHAREAPRFGLLALAGWAIAAGAPALLTGQLGLPAVVPIAVTCVLVPVVNFLAMDRLVFTGAAR
jgi:putative flippase GtrA